MSGGTVELPIARHRLWDALAHPERFAPAMPQVSDFELRESEPGAFEARLAPATAFGTVPVRTAWRRSRCEAPSALSYAIAGRTDEHVLDLQIDLDLADAETGDGTQVRWVSSVRASGTLGSIGQRVLGAVVDQHVRLALTAVASAALDGR